MNTQVRIHTRTVHRIVSITISGLAIFSDLYGSQRRNTPTDTKSQQLLLNGLKRNEWKQILKARYDKITNDGDNPYHVIRDMILQDEHIMDSLERALTWPPHISPCKIQEGHICVSEGHVYRSIHRYHKNILSLFQEYRRHMNRPVSDGTIQLRYMLAYSKPVHMLWKNRFWDLRNYLRFDSSIFGSSIYYFKNFYISDDTGHSAVSDPDYENFGCDSFHPYYVRTNHITINVTIHAPHQKEDGRYEYMIDIDCIYCDSTDPIE